MGTVTAAAGRRRRRRYAVSAAVALVVALVVTWVAVGWDHLVTPEVDAVAPVDAVFVIGPAELRMPQARQLVEEAGATVLLTTTSVDPDTGIAYPRGYCDEVTDTYRVECVIPEPYSTRGEARLLAAEAEEHGWSRVAVVTSVPHAARTRLLVERCTDAEVLVWTVYERRSLLGDVGQFVYQSGAWVKTQVLRDC